MAATTTRHNVFGKDERGATGCLQPVRFGKHGLQASRGTHHLRKSARTVAILAAVALTSTAAWPVAGLEAAQKFLVPDGNRSTAVHRIPLLADPVLKGDEKPLAADDKPALPYSPRATCSGRCHDYSAIETGWHFNAPDPKAPPGRPGEPYVLTDLATGTQIPISPRGWPGTYRPAAVGLTPWKFVLAFGGHTPGGGYGERFAGGPADDPQARWQVSGRLEIDCQSCHSGDPLQDESLWATNIERENFQWAATAACGFALVRGIAKTVPETWDPMTPSTGDNPKEFPPSIAYDAWRFNSLKEVFFDTVGKPANDRCYHCHTNRPVGKDVPEKWQQDEDVHVKAGLRCADCHRHGLNHAMTRNYEGESSGSEATLTCRGCHLGEASAAGRLGDGGRLGAPVPIHKGIPTIHFEKLACTTCHSGPWPGKAAGHVQTSRVHGLGVKAKEHRDDAPPFIQWPVFMREGGPQGGGKIAPHKIIWPAFWGREKDGNITPLDLAVVRAAAGANLASDNLKLWKPLSRDQIATILLALDVNKGDSGDPVYVGGGLVYRLDPMHGVILDASPISSVLRSSKDHPAAAPYAWPLAHDVRPKSQSLGSGGCTDCHALDSPIFFGEVVADSTAETRAPLVKAMYEFEGKDPMELWAWGMSYMFRPMFKVVGFVTAGVIAAVLLAYVLMGLAALARWAAKRAPQGPAA